MKKIKFIKELAICRYSLDLSYKLWLCYYNKEKFDFTFPKILDIMKSARFSTYIINEILYRLIEIGDKECSANQMYDFAEFLEDKLSKEEIKEMSKLMGENLVA